MRGFLFYKTRSETITQTKLIRDALGSPIPQLYDAVEGKWVVDDGSITIAIANVDGLQTKLDEVT